MRILQGVTGQAGQPTALSAALRRLGVECETCAIKEHKFGYSYDRYVDVSKVTNVDTLFSAIRPLAERFDVFHFHARSFAVEWPELNYPSGLDLLILKLLGKRIFFHFRGQEARLASQFKNENPFHYVDDDSGYLFKRMPDSSKILMRGLVSSICDGVFAVDPELQTYVPGSIVIPRALEASEWPFVGVSARSEPIVVHAPSRRGVKGTAALLRAADQLRSEGVKFQLQLVENMEHSKAMALYKDADVIVDQLRIGWYGVLAVEGMALGKPVIAYVRDDLWRTHGTDLPIINANPETITDKLRSVLVSLELRQRHSLASRRYFERVHSADAVASKLLKHYEAAPRPIQDVELLARYLDNQFFVSSALTSPSLRRSSFKRLQSRINLFFSIYRSDGAVTALTTLKRHLKNRWRRA